MTEFVFQLAILFMPGLIWLAVVDALTTGKKRDNLGTLLAAFAFGAGSYLVYFGLYYLGRRVWDGVWPTLLDGVVRVPIASDLHNVSVRHVFLTSLLAPLLGVVWSLGANQKWFLRVMHWLHVTRKFGDESVWDYTFNMGVAVVEYVNVRDLDAKITYAGYVKAFSTSGEIRELLLGDVRVFDSDTSQFLYEMPMIYLSRKTESLHVEYPYNPTAIQPQLSPPKAVEENSP